MIEREVVHDGIVDTYGVGVSGATVHNAVPDRIDSTGGVEEVAQRSIMHLAGPSLDGVLLDHPVIAVEQLKLQAARSSVDDKHSLAVHTRVPLSCPNDVTL